MISDSLSSYIRITVLIDDTKQRNVMDASFLVSTNISLRTYTYIFGCFDAMFIFAF